MAGLWALLKNGKGGSQGPAWLGRLRIAHKILIAPLTIAAVLVAAVAAGWLALERQAERIETTVGRDLAATRAASRLMHNLAKTQAALFRLQVYATSDLEGRLVEDVRTNLEEHIAAVEENFDRLKAARARPKGSWAALGKRITDYLDQVAASRRVVQARPGFGHSMMITTAEKYDSLIAEIEAMQRRVELGAQRRARAAAGLAQDSGRALAASAIGALILALLLTWAVSRHITRGLYATTANMRALANNETEAEPAEQNRRDEVGEIARAIAATMGELRAKNAALAEEKNQTNQALEELNYTYRELQRSNVLLEESLSYAQSLQEAILPEPDPHRFSLADLAVWWQPRDKLSGDLYHLHRQGQQVVITVVDCTGHGVPGALISFTVLAALNRVLLRHETYRPAAMLADLDSRLRETLHGQQAPASRRSPRAKLGDDGCEAGMAAIDMETGESVFAGVGIPAIVEPNGGGAVYRANRGGLGYASMAAPSRIDEHRLDLGAGDCLTLATDGVLELLGGRPVRQLGRTGLKGALYQRADSPDLAAKRDGLRADLDAWRGDQPYRDDITLVTVQPFAAPQG